jgi:hypothetical protein
VKRLFEGKQSDASNESAARAVGNGAQPLARPGGDLLAGRPDPEFALALILAVSSVSLYAALFILAHFPRNRKDDP